MHRTTPYFVLFAMLLAVACSAPAKDAGGDQTTEAKGETAMTPQSLTNGTAPPRAFPSKESFDELCEAELSVAKELFASLEGTKAPYTIQSVLEPMNQMNVKLDHIINISGLIQAVHPKEDVRKAAEVCEQKAMELATKISLSKPVYDAVKGTDVASADAKTKRYVEHLVRDFERAGVDKDEPTRKKIQKLKEELVEIGQTFSRNIRDDVKEIMLDSAAMLEGLPEDFIAAHPAGADGKVKLTTEYPDYIPLMTYAKSDEARKAMHKAFNTRAWPKNLEVLKSLLVKRKELVDLLGYSDWADYIVEDKMIKEGPAIKEFIDKVASIAAPKAKEEYSKLLAAVQADFPDAKEVGDWQKTYYLEKVKEATFDFDSQEVRKYLPFGSVKKGVLDTAAKVFGLTFVPVDVPTWHEDVVVYEVREGDTLIARLYLDLHPRPNKYGHAAAFPIVSGVEGEQIPEVALVCNFPGQKDPNELMGHNQVVTFFHEFGHALHHMIGGRVAWVETSGFNTEWDFVEVPSQAFEEWAWDYDVLEQFAKDPKTGAVIPKALVDKMNKTRHFGKALGIERQMYFAMLAYDFHSIDPTKVDLVEEMKKVMKEYHPYPYVDDTYMLVSFGHLNGYSAMYYTYMWSLVIVKDVLAQFDKGLLDPVKAALFKKSILEPGGSVDAVQMCEDFLGRSFDMKAFEAYVKAE